MYYRFDLTDAQWEKIQGFFPDRYHQAGLLERDLWAFDGTIDRAHTSAAGAKKIPRSRRSWADLRRRNCKSRRTMRWGGRGRSEEHTSELQSRRDLVCRLLLEK